jgi:DNA-binding SARP family transcriptional activator/tetratricopeptide (TPR) repeat protein
MLFRILGPLEVRKPAGWEPVAAPKWRLLLAALLLHRGQVVPSDRLVDELWGDDAPQGAHKLVSGYVSRLRRVIGDPAGRVLVTRSPGYQLLAGRDDVDVSRFEDLIAEGRQALHAEEPGRAATLLAEALSLWRGPALADVPPGRLVSAEAGRLDELRLHALELRIDADLGCGRGSEVIPELRRLTAEHPLRERLWSGLMRALHAYGQSAEALEVYARARQVIADELGADPGPELQELHVRILNGEPAPAVPAPAGPGGTGALRAPPGPPAVPRQLPAAGRHFVGREEELARLSSLLGEVAGDAGDDRGGVVIAAISGTAGVGKSALAVHWSQQVCDRFPDGQLYVNLRGFDPSGKPVTPAEAVQHFLDGLGVPPGRVPASPEAQAALLRSLLASRRVLIVLDNARDAAQVRPLLPGSSGCLVLVTSRSQLGGLAATDSAHLLILDVLSDGEASDLIARRLGPARVAAEPAAVAELTGLCARLPLALSIAASRAAAHPQLPVAALAADLRDSHDRLDELDTGDAAASIRAVFSWSYQQLSSWASLMFRLLGVHPGPDITAAAGASMAGVPLPRARQALRELARAHLVAEQRAGRYTCHDLLRAYAAELAHDQREDPGGRAALSRARDHYLYSAQAASSVLYPFQPQPPLRPPQAGVRPERPASDAAAQDWFRAEHPALLALIGQADRLEGGPEAWQLPVVLADFLNRHGHWRDLAATQRAALAIAIRLGDLAGQAHAHHGLAVARLRLSSADEAAGHARRALSLFAELGDRNSEARTHLTLAAVLQQRGEHADALRHTEQALGLYRAGGNKAGAAHALSNLGWYHARVGDFQQALSTSERALRKNRDVGNRLVEAHTWDHLGFVLHNLHRHTEACTCYHRALRLLHEVNDRYEQAGVLTRLGDAYHATSDQRAARRTWKQALAIYEDLHHPDADQILARIHTL